ncbi:MAG: GNAT family N-acetyltransferase [Streptosporangiaceae bacterium]
MSLHYPIRPVGPDDLTAFLEPSRQAFNTDWSAANISGLDEMVFEPERTLAAFDGDQIVGSAIAYSFGLTVPGGDVPAAGVSSVAVLPSHRRRGILSALMTRQIDDVLGRGEPVAALFASESAIYQRYGYGPAVAEQRYVINCRVARFRERPQTAASAAGTGPRTGPGRPAGPVALRIAEPKAVLPEMAEVYEAVRPTRPGMISRPGAWWNLAVSDPEFARRGRSPLLSLIAEGDSGPRGYALYATKDDWDADGIADGGMVVHELFSPDPAAYAALWTDLLSRDLVTTARAYRRPVDDPLPFLLTESRQVRARQSDGLWIRLVDLPAALAARRYLRPVDLVIEVTDALVPANAGRWRLRAGAAERTWRAADAAEAICERTTADADIAVDVSALGAAYLGGTRLSALAQAGQVTESRHGAVAELSAAMSWDPAPWAPIMF